MLPRLSLETPTVAVAPPAVFGGPDDDLPPPPQPATASAASRSKAPAAGKVLSLLAFIVLRLLSSPFAGDRNSLVPSRPRGIGGTGCPVLPLTAVLEFLLAGSDAGRWRRRPERAQASSWAQHCRDQERT